MPAHDAPLSLQELLALRKKGQPSAIGAKDVKTRFLTKAQREKLEKGKELRLQQELPDAKSNDKVHSKPDHIEDNPVSIGVKQPQGKPSSNLSKNTKSSKSYKFEWDESEDTSGYNDLPVVKRKPQSNDLLDLPYRKKSKANEFSNLHWTQKPLEKMNDRDWRIFKEDFQITLRGNSQPQMIRYWDESNISKDILSLINSLNYKIPTPIQRASIPSALNGNDVLGIAETGSGKTLAFIVPAISYVLNLPPVGPMESPYVLIVVPTRELAQQIETEFQKFMDRLPFNVASIIGGETYEANLDKLERGVEILVGTPGRLLDILDKKVIDLNRCYYLIADEADKMIDMGFEKQFLQILDHLPPGSDNIFTVDGKEAKRMTMMFTATMPPQISRIVDKYMIKPVTVIVGDQKNAVSSVVQDAIQVPVEDEQKVEILKKVLRRFPSPIVVFVNYTKMCEYLSKHLTRMGYKPAIIHGGRNQSQREAAIAQMKNGQCDVLIATDVAARGIDIPNVSLVVNYQMSNSISEYIHRIGRTGRAGKTGTAITFWNPQSDANVLHDLKKTILNSTISNCPEDLRKLGKDGSFANIEN